MPFPSVLRTGRGRSCLLRYGLVVGLGGSGLLNGPHRWTLRRRVARWLCDHCDIALGRELDGPGRPHPSNRVFEAPIVFCADE